MLHRIRQFILILSLALTLSLLAGPALAQDGVDPQVQTGAQLYGQNCAVCHGANGQGRVGATLAKNWPSIRPDLQVENIIRNGVAGSPMPAWSLDNGGPLSDAEIDALVTYILSWQTGEIYIYTPETQPTARPAREPLPGVEGDPNRGGLLYDQNCAVCHGANGQGRIGVTLAQNWPSIRPDLKVKQAISSGVMGSPMPAWSLDNGGPLSESDINDITAFILSLPVPQGEIAATATPTPAPNTGVSGLVGVFLTIILFTLIVSLILFAQRRHA